MAADARSPQYREASARLLALNPLRESDPAAVLRAVAQMHEAGPLPAHEAALLQAQRLLLRAGARLRLNEAAGARSELRALDELLSRPPLAAAAGQPQVREYRMQALNIEALIAHGHSDFPAALQAYLGALALADSLGARADQARLHGNLANTYEESGLAAESIEHQRIALALAQELGLQELVLDTHHNLGNALASSGDPEAALPLHHRAFDGFGALGLATKQAMTLMGIAERQLELGRHDQALQTLARRHAFPQVPQSVPIEAYACGLEARCLLAQGTPAAARAALMRALQACARVDDRAGQARALIGLARLDLEAGALDAAARRSTAALAALDGTAAGRELVDAHLWASRVAEASGDAGQALQQMKLHHAVYERLFNEQSSLKARLLAIRHQVELARGEAERERLENARLNEALAEVAARLRRLESGAQPAARPPGPEALRALGLTLREAEVLYWVTQGKTNEDVAAILDTGMPAVKKHLGRIYGKLGVENRTAAAAEVRRRVAN